MASEWLERWYSSGKRTWVQRIWEWILKQKEGSESSTKGICQYRGRRVQLILLIAQASAFRMHSPLWFRMINKSYTAIFLWLFPSKHKTSPLRHHAAGRQNTWMWNIVLTIKKEKIKNGAHNGGHVRTLAKISWGQVNQYSSTRQGSLFSQPVKIQSHMCATISL